MSAENRTRWALVLGASSGFGEACSLALARAGWNIFGVHLDRKATQSNVDRIVAEIGATGRRAEFFNVNAADEEKRAEVVAAIAKTCGGEPPEGARVGAPPFARLRHAQAGLRRDPRGVAHQGAASR